MYTWLTINSQHDLDRLQEFIDVEYEPLIVAERLKDGISDLVKGILIEENYIDKDYRSTYYNFYSKKGQLYRPDCVRLHFFGAGVSFSPESLTLAHPGNKIDDYYLGYMVLRPTGIATVGRSVLSSSIRRGVNGVIIKSSHKIHLLGHEITVRGMPSMDQHSDISVCAHAACWSILRHYSQRYSNYKEFLTYDITLMAQEFNPGGLNPSKGLSITHAERIFQAAGTFPLLVTRGEDKSEDADFYKQLHAYLDSGFPLFGAMSERGHAVAIVGYEWRSTPSGTSGTAHSWDEVSSLIVVDDNHLPYQSIPRDKAEGDPSPYSISDIDSFIVPLPEKVFYSAEAVNAVAPNLYRLSEIVQLPPFEEVITRFFITTSSRLRNFVHKRRSEFDPQLCKVIMAGLQFPQFVWIVEFATKEDWEKGQISARAVLDATASVYDVWPIWLLHNREVALAFDRQSVNDFNRMRTIKLSGMDGALTRMEENLQPVRAS